MNLEYLVPLAKIADCLQYPFSHQVTAFQPAADAETHPHVRTIGHLQGSLIAIEAAEDAARHSGQFGYRGIIGMNSNQDTFLFSYRRYLLDKIAKVLPNLILGI